MSNANVVINFNKDLNINLECNEINIFEDALSESEQIKTLEDALCEAEYGIIYYELKIIQIIFNSYDLDINDLDTNDLDINDLDKENKIKYIKKLRSKLAIVNNYRNSTFKKLNSLKTNQNEVLKTPIKKVVKRDLQYKNNDKLKLI